MFSSILLFLLSWFALGMITLVPLCRILHAVAVDDTQLSELARQANTKKMAVPEASVRLRQIAYV